MISSTTRRFPFVLRKCAANIRPSLFGYPVPEHQRLVDQARKGNKADFPPARLANLSQEVGGLREGERLSKLLKLKEWLTVEEASKRLSITAGEEVTEADVLRLALDGHLTLSVYFVNHATARMGKFVPLNETKWFFAPPLFHLSGGLSLTEETVSHYPNHLQQLWRDTPLDQRKDCVPLLASLATEDNRFINLEEEVTTLTGVWDLPFVGCERLDVEHAYQLLTGGPEVTLEGLDGAFVSRDEATVCQLQESWEKNPYMAGSLAELERLKEAIADGEMPAERVDELLTKHKKARVLFIEEQRNRTNAQRYHPAGGVPRDSVFVVRTSALRALEEKLLADEVPQEKPLHPSERKSTAQIIATLAAMAELDLSTPYAADETLRAAAATFGLELPSSSETVAKFLKDAAARTGKA